MQFTDLHRGLNLCLSLMFLAACQPLNISNDDDVPIKSPGNKPLAVAGVDIEVLEGETFALSGAGSSDVDEDLQSYLWEQIYGDIQILGSPSAQRDISLVAPQVDQNSLLIFKLTVTDSKDNHDSDFINVYVQNDSSSQTPTNRDPVANAGVNRSVVSGAEVTLSAAQSSDADGDQLSFQWTLLNRSEPALQNSDQADVSFIAPQVSANTPLNFRLQVTDGRGGSDSTDITVTVLPNNSFVPDHYPLEGFGSVTQGALSSPDSFEIVHVTNLNNSGPGSLREAISAEKRYIVFDVGGTITLPGTADNDLHINHSYITIDGASAPAPGITIVQEHGSGTAVLAKTGQPVHDVLIHHLRHRGPGGHDGTSDDIWGLDGQDAPVYNVALDHITAYASNDGVFDVWGDVHDVTISWNIIADTITANHFSMQTAQRSNFSVHHNLFMGNNERQIRLRHDNRSIDFVNNVIYGWGWMEANGYGMTVISDNNQFFPSVNIIGNVFHYLSGNYGSPNDAIIIDINNGPSQIYFADNIVPSSETDPQTMGTITAVQIPDHAKVTTHAASTLATQLIPLVGTQLRTTEEVSRLATIASAITP